MTYIVKNSPARREAILDFTHKLVDTHIYLNGEKQDKFEVFDRHYKEPQPGQADWGNTELEMVKGKCHPHYEFRDRPMEWADKHGVWHTIDPQHSGEEAEAENTKALVRQKCMAELRKQNLMMSGNNEVTMHYNELLDITVDVSYKMLLNAFKIWEVI